MQLGLLMSEKCGIFIANSICIQYADLQILNSLPKSLLSKLADSLHLHDEPEGTCWWAGDRALHEHFRSHLYVLTRQCPLARPRGAGTSPWHGVFLTGIWAQVPRRCQHCYDALLRTWSKHRYLCPELWWVLQTQQIASTKRHQNEMLFSKWCSSLLKCLRWHTQQPLPL